MYTGYSDKAPPVGLSKHELMNVFAWRVVIDIHNTCELWQKPEKKTRGFPMKITNTIEHIHLKVMIQIGTILQCEVSHSSLAQNSCQTFVPHSVLTQEGYVESSSP